MTPNQGKAFPWIKDKANVPVQIEVRANNGKLRDLGIKQGDFINITGIGIHVSKPGDVSIIGQRLNY